MTPEPTVSSVVTAAAPLYALDVPVVPILLTVLAVVAIALLVRSRRRQRSSSDGS